jgi:glycogen phosphorylase
MNNMYGNLTGSQESTQLDGISELISLALDMRWSWNHEADDLWQQLDAALWEESHNPWVVLQTVSGDALKRQMSDPAYRARVDALLKKREEWDTAVSWFAQAHADKPIGTIAYFSMEFMLSEALPIYVGGLGNVAGDQLKAASDLGVPVVGIGLLYQQGYFRQVIDKNGQQQAYNPFNDPGQLPITPLRQANGDWLRLQVPFPGGPLWLRAWQVQVGRVKLYLLDTNDVANLAIHRGITGTLYGGDNTMRIKQEIVLGIGGWRLLAALGIEPDVCHLNEGHAAFAILERARSYMEKTGLSFAEALAVTRAGNLFTSHTAVAAGFDHFDPGLVSWYLGEYATQRLHISIADLIALGRQYPYEIREPFNMAYLAIHGSGSVNGVSSLHGRVSRHLFEPLFYRWPTEEVPVGHVTNGVHMPSWDSAASDDLWTEACGKGRWMGVTEELGKDILKVTGDKIWQMRATSRASLVDYIRQKVTGELAADGASAQEISEAQNLFDPHTLTLGFARRFVGYKRPDLLLQDPARLVRLLTNSQQPVQLVIAGKAPPADQEGIELIRRWKQFITQWNMSRHVIFLSDYDMLLAEHLVEGVDVWLNTPQRPWEASGTSGMKVLVNGGINLSELDGWWAEAYTPAVGWALGDGKEHGNDPAWDAQEAQWLYKILEEEVVPSFYQRGQDNIPGPWVEKIRQSMATLTPYFSANRTVREYTDKFYISGAKAYRERTAQNGAAGKAIVSWKHEIEQGWPKLYFKEVKVNADPEQGQNYFEVQVFLGDIKADQVSVELYAQGINGGPAERVKLDHVPGAPVSPGVQEYTGKVSALRPAGDYTARVIPAYPGVKVPLEAAQVLWQR